MEKKEPPYADMLRAMADGKQMQRRLVAVRPGEWCWEDCSHNDCFCLLSDNPFIACQWLRIKPETVLRCNGVVITPLLVAPELGDDLYMAIAVTNKIKWTGTDTCRRLLSERRLYKDGKDAIIHIAAMLIVTEGEV